MGSWVASSRRAVSQSLQNAPVSENTLCRKMLEDRSQRRVLKPVAATGARAAASSNTPDQNARLNVIALLTLTIYQRRLCDLALGRCASALALQFGRPRTAVGVARVRPGCAVRSENSIILQGVTGVTQFQMGCCRGLYTVERMLSCRDVSRL